MTEISSDPEPTRTENPTGAEGQGGSAIPALSTANGPGEGGPGRVPDGKPAQPVKTPPKELGVMLVSAGLIGVVLPGPGAPALLAGGLILWPEGFGKVEA